MSEETLFQVAVPDKPSTPRDILTLLSSGAAETTTTIPMEDMVDASKAQAGTSKRRAKSLDGRQMRSKRRVPEIDLVRRALHVLGSPDRVARWLQSPLGVLRGRTPYSLLGSEKGRKEVDTVLGRIEHGIY